TRVVEHADESRGIAFRRHIAASVGPRGTEYGERRMRDERPAVLVEPRDLLLQRDLARTAEQRAQVLLVGDQVTEHRVLQVDQSIAVCTALLTRSMRRLCHG